MIEIETMYLKHFTKCSIKSNKGEKVEKFVLFIVLHKSHSVVFINENN